MNESISDWDLVLTAQVDLSRAQEEPYVTWSTHWIDLCVTDGYCRTVAPTGANG